MADKRYKGALLGRIYTGMPLQSALILEPSLVFDEMEEVYHIPGIKGVAVEADGWNDAIAAISVYVSELADLRSAPGKSEAFERGHWS